MRLHKIKYVLTIIFIMVLFISCEKKGDDTLITKIVDEQLDAYNNRDIDAFMKTYHDEIKVYIFPETLSMDGKKALRDAYGTKFKELKTLNASISKRMTIGNKVIDDETATFTTEKDVKSVKAVVIYEIKGALFLGI